MQLARRRRPTVGGGRARRAGALALALVAASAARAVAQSVPEEDESWVGSGGVELYVDTDNTTVVTTIVDGSIRVADDWLLSPHVVIDVVSSASVDVISAATPSFSTPRLQPGLGATWQRPNDEAIRVDVVASLEPDWQSFSARATWTREFLHRNLGVGLAYGATYSAISDSRSGYDTSESLWAHTWQADISQLLDRRTRVALSHTGQIDSGYTASVYRTVSFADGMTLPEEHPELRVRLSGSLSLSRYLGHDVGLLLSYRLYDDSWSLLSHTFAVSAMWDTSDAVSLRLRARVYTQSAADFYEEGYATPLGLTAWTRDKELAGAWNAGGGAGLTWHLGETLDLGARAEVYRYTYRDFAPLANMTAFITGLTLTTRR